MSLGIRFRSSMGEIAYVRARYSESSQSMMHETYHRTAIVSIGSHRVNKSVVHVVCAQEVPKY